MINDQDKFIKNNIHCFKETDAFPYGVDYPGWYFTDEAYNYHGPFSTYEEAVELLKGYASQLSGDPSNAE